MKRHETLHNWGDNPEGWEADAHAFYVATGYMRPGKDDRQARHNMAERYSAWLAWVDEEVDQPKVPNE